MIEVACVGGKCDGLTVRIDPEMSMHYEVVDPRDKECRDFYIVEVNRGATRLVPKEAPEPPAAIT